jgi:uncharacterized protein (DUF1800 family)
MPWRIAEAEHLLRRVGFGGSLAQVNAVYSVGANQAIENLLNYQNVADPVWDDPNPLDLSNYQTSKWSARRNLLYKVATSTRPLQSRLLWFWHGHFTTSLEFTTIKLMERQMSKWRGQATGNFLEFLFDMYTDGAMLQYLDGASNNSGAPNENFARENFELFTLGVGNYTETDVREAARAFTGLVVGVDGTVSRDSSLYDGGEKTILGRTGNFSGNDVMRLVFNRDETVQRICTKLYRCFVSDVVDVAEVNAMMNTWLEGNGNMRHVVRTLLRLPGFWAAANRQALIKSPLEFCLGLVQRLELGVGQSLIDRLLKALPPMGMTPFIPPTPAGYAPGDRVMGASRLVARYRFAYHCVYERSTDTVMSTMASGLPSTLSSTQLIATIAGRMGLHSLTSATQEAVSTYLGTAAVNKSNLTSKTLDTVYLLACSPEYQLA